MLKLAKVSKSTYYYVLNSLKRQDKYKHIKELIVKIFNENKGRYGYRRITLTLVNEYNVSINHKTIQRLMKILGLKRKAIRELSREEGDSLIAFFISLLPLCWLQDDQNYSDTDGLG